MGLCLYPAERHGLLGMTEEKKSEAAPSGPAQETVLSSARFLWSFLSAKRRRHFWLTMAVMLLGAVAELATIGAVIPFLALISNPEGAADVPGLGLLIELLGRPDHANLVLFATLLLVGAAIFAAAIRLWLTWASLKFVLALSHEIGIEVFARMMRQPYSFHVTRNTSELLAGIEKVTTAVWGVLMPLMQGLTAGVIALAIITLLFLIDPLTATVAAAAMSLCYVAVTIAVRRLLHRNSVRLSRSSVGRIQTVQEGLGGIRDVLLEQSQELFEGKFRRMDYEYRRALVINNFVNLAPRYIVEATGIVLIAVLALFLSWQAGGIAVAIPVLGSLALGAQRLLPLLQQAYIGWSSLAGNRQMLFDVIGLMQTPVVSSEPRDRSKSIEFFKKDLALQNVSFQYQSREYALADINLTIPKGARIGFIGETGSGKSTLLDLIMGLLEPTSGRILIDGNPLTDKNRANWQAQIAHVPQAIYLSDSSIAANIAFGEAEDELDMDRVRSVARMAHIDSFIMELEQGYDTPVGERGVRLSGGQRQRIGLARALYKRSSVLILDEATSALDDATEAAIMQSIFSLGTDLTILMIAHRTSTLVGCERIVRLDSGRIVEVGTYEETIGVGRVA